jgi:bacillolysin
LKRIPRLLLSLAASAALTGGTLAVTGSPGTAAADAQSTGSSHLAADATGRLTYRSAGSGYDFVGVPAGVTVDDPGVSASTSVADAAAAHLARYGAAFGADQAGTTLSRVSSASTVAGDVVRYQQKVGGIPVMAGEIAVSLRPDRELSSILAHTSRATGVPSVQVGEATARATANRAFARKAGQGGAPHITSLGRWVIDPTLIGASASLPIRTAWRFEITRGADERRLLLVDDQTGSVLMNNDLIDHALNRIVCDNNEVVRVHADDDEAPCTDPAQLDPPAERVEGGGATGTTDVDSAYDLAGAVSSTYAGLGVDLTDLIGRDLTGAEAGSKALAQTVRMCYNAAGGGCPYGNAFWNGKQMYYGTGFAEADDVVGHEMTHGVTERNSGLVYWGQSGAMNESISDIMGEIVDHQYVTPSDATQSTPWSLGEDIPGIPDGIRNMKDPTLFGDPDKTSSTLYKKETCRTTSCYPDEDGVHSNSGVGNHTFYLISQGGTFNNQTIAGIDGADPNLVKSAKLWLLTDQTLTSGSDYADEAAVLEQSCAALQATAVMTAADCAVVHQATLATELRSTPVKNPQPADAEASCPSGTKQVLFESETGTPADKFTAGAGWSRDGIPGTGQVAHSAPAAWSNVEATTSGSTSLTAAAPISLPAGQPAYLFFQQWRALDYDQNGFYDAGTVEVNGTSTSTLPWVNGPGQTIASGTGNPKAGQLGFGGDSRGYLASRVDLTSFTGQLATPRFTVSTDSTDALIGWYIDDVQVYTCADPEALANTAKPVASGTPQVGQTLTVAPGTWDAAGASFTYQWLSNGTPVAGATGTTFAVTPADLGAQLSARVTGTASGFLPGTADSNALGPVTAAPLLTVVAGSPTISGKAVVGKKLTAHAGAWTPGDATLSYQWLRNGTPVAGATGSTYKMKNKDKGKKISVQVTGVRSGYTSASATSPQTKKVKKKKHHHHHRVALGAARLE